MGLFISQCMAYDTKNKPIQRKKPTSTSREQVAKAKTNIELLNLGAFSD